MDRGSWWATVCGVTTELEVTEHRRTQEDPDGRDAEGKECGKAGGVSMPTQSRPLFQQQLRKSLNPVLLGVLRKLYYVGMTDWVIGR